VDGRFSPAMKKFFFTGPDLRDDSKSGVEIVIEIPDNLAEITSGSLQKKDEKWLLITSASDWAIDQQELIVRFGLKTNLPNYQVEFPPIGRTHDGAIRV